MSSSLYYLIKNIPNDNKIFLNDLAKTDADFGYMDKKGQFPYKWLDNTDESKVPMGFNDKQWSITGLKNFISTIN